METPPSKRPRLSGNNQRHRARRSSSLREKRVRFDLGDPADEFSETNLRRSKSDDSMVYVARMLLAAEGEEVNDDIEYEESEGDEEEECAEGESGPSRRSNRKRGRKSSYARLTEDSISYDVPESDEEAMQTDEFAFADPEELGERSSGPGVTDPLSTLLQRSPHDVQQKLSRGRGKGDRSKREAKTLTEQMQEELPSSSTHQPASGTDTRGNSKASSLFRGSATRIIGALGKLPRNLERLLKNPLSSRSEGKSRDDDVSAADIGSSVRGDTAASDEPVEPVDNFLPLSYGMLHLQPLDSARSRWMRSKRRHVLEYPGLDDLSELKLADGMPRTHSNFFLTLCQEMETATDPIAAVARLCNLERRRVPRLRTSHRESSLLLPAFKAGGCQLLPDDACRTSLSFYPQLAAVTPARMKRDFFATVSLGTIGDSSMHSVLRVAAGFHLVDNKEEYIAWAREKHPAVDPEDMWKYSVMNCCRPLESHAPMVWQAVSNVLSTSIHVIDMKDNPDRDTWQPETYYPTELDFAGSKCIVVAVRNIVRDKIPMQPGLLRTALVEYSLIIDRDHLIGSYDDAFNLPPSTSSAQCPFVLEVLEDRDAWEAKVAEIATREHASRNVNWEAQPSLEDSGSEGMDSGLMDTEQEEGASHDEDSEQYDTALFCLPQYLNVQGDYSIFDLIDNCGGDIPNEYPALPPPGGVFVIEKPPIGSSGTFHLPNPHRNRVKRNCQSTIYIDKET